VRKDFRRLALGAAAHQFVDEAGGFQLVEFDHAFAVAFAGVGIDGAAVELLFIDQLADQCFFP